MIIVTLGTYSMFHGLSLVLSHSAAVVPPDDSGSFFRFSQSYVGKVPTLAIIFVVLAIVLHVVLQRTRFGFRVQAIGSNPEAARLAGIPAARTRILVLGARRARLRTSRAASRSGSSARSTPTRAATSC